MKIDLSINSSSHNSILKSFQRIAKELLNNYIIEIDNKKFQILIIEFYYHSETHTDDSIHFHHKQLSSHKWYIHCKTINKKSKRNGIDYTFGNKINYGSILIKRVKQLDSTEKGEFTQSLFVKKLIEIIKPKDFDQFLYEIDQRLKLVYQNKTTSCEPLRWTRENITKGHFIDKGYAFRLEN